MTLLSSRALRRFIWKQVALRKWHRTRSRNPPIFPTENCCQSMSESAGVNHPHFLYNQHKGLLNQRRPHRARPTDCSRQIDAN